MDENDALLPVQVSPHAPDLSGHKRSGVAKRNLRARVLARVRGVIGSAPVWMENQFARIADHIGKWSLLRLLDHVAKLSILAAVVSYAVGAPDRRRERHYQAWNVINAAQGKGGNGGRMDALQDLAKDRVSLSGVNAAHAYLSGVRLPNAKLTNANLDSAELYAAELTGASLEQITARGANLMNARLRGANLLKADLRNADLSYADLENANLSDADLRGAILWGANLRGADLSLADLRGAFLRDANLRNIDLHQADLRGAQMKDVRNWRHVSNLHLANVYGVYEAPPAFASWAVDSMRAVSAEEDRQWGDAIVVWLQAQYSK